MLPPHPTDIDRKPRAPRPDERGDRHDEPAARHPARARAARVRGGRQGSGESLLAVVNDILDFSKIEAGRVELEEDALSVRTCVAESICIVEARAAEQDLRIVSQVGDAVPDAVVGLQASGDAPAVEPERVRRGA
jgi:signal transduction histidine kinase